jgi:hypothetical protein
MLRAFFWILGLTFSATSTKDTSWWMSGSKLLNLVRPVEQQVEAFAQIVFFRFLCSLFKIITKTYRVKIHNKFTL